MYDTEGEWESHDIRTAESYGVPKADLWTFGFPCQDLSIAGKRKGLQEGERSGLFYEIVRLLSGLAKEDRPKWLLAENVKGLFSAGRGFDFLRCIVELGQLGYDIQYQLLNSKDFGVPQNRERVFIVGYLGDGSRRKVFPIRPTDGENTCAGQEQRPVRLFNIYGENRGTGFAGNVWDKNAISPTLTTMGGGNREPMIVDAIFKNREPRITDIAPTLRSPVRGLSVAVPEPKVIDAIYNNREPRVTDIAPTLRADRQGLCVTDEIKLIGNYMPSGHAAGRVVDPKGIAPTVMDNHGLASAVAIDLTENKPKVTETARCLQSRYNKGYSTRSAECSGVLVEANCIDIYNNKIRTDGCTGTLTTNGNTSARKCGTFGIQSGMRIRKLTPRECYRLQGFPDEYFDRAAAVISNSQLYKTAGNAVTVNVAEAIGRRLKELEMNE